MAAKSVKAERGPLSKDEFGAAGDMEPLDRVNRIQSKLRGLHMLGVLLDDAKQRSDGSEATPLVWSEVFFFISGVAEDLRHEVGALYDQMCLAEEAAP